MSLDSLNLQKVTFFRLAARLYRTTRAQTGARTAHATTAHAHTWGGIGMACTHTHDGMYRWHAQTAYTHGTRTTAGEKGRGSWNGAARASMRGTRHSSPTWGGGTQSVPTPPLNNTKRYGYCMRHSFFSKHMARAEYTLHLLITSGPLARKSVCSKCVVITATPGYHSRCRCSHPGM